MPLNEPYASDLFQANGHAEKNGKVRRLAAKPTYSTPDVDHSAEGAAAFRGPSAKEIAAEHTFEVPDIPDDSASKITGAEVGASIASAAHAMAGAIQTGQEATRRKRKANLGQKSRGLRRVG